MKPPVEIHPDIFRITLPLAGKRPGPVNVYLFKRDPVALIDTGTRKTVDVLKDSLASCGVRFGDIDRILLTHGHIDHYGGARRIQREAGRKIPIMAHPDDARHIEHGLEAPVNTYDRFLILMGVPLHMRLGILLLFGFFKTMAVNCPVDREIQEGDVVELGVGKARIMSTPGHTRGSVSFHLEDGNILFAGDHMLDHITPNAIVMLEPGQVLPVRRSQEEFYASLARIEALNPDIVHPAHGRPITDCRKTIERYRTCYRNRSEAIMAELASGEQTIYPMARRLFPELSGIRLPLEIFLAISEVYSHLQMLELENRIEFRNNGERIMARAK